MISVMKIMFVCLGNICRSAMAEFMMKDELKKRGLFEKYFVDSSATCGLEAGNPVYPAALKKLKSENVPVYQHYSKQVKKSDYDNFDLFLGMDDKNIAYLKNLFSGDDERKVKKFLEFTGESRDVADPYYTGNFDNTYDDLKIGIDCLIKYIENRK